MMPEVVELKLADAAKLGVAIEGSASAWPGAAEESFFPSLILLPVNGTTWMSSTGDAHLFSFRQQQNRGSN